MSNFETQSNYLQNMYDELKEEVITCIENRDFNTQEGLDEWVYWNTNSDSVDYQHYQHYILSMSSAEIRFAIAEIQQHFKEEYDMSVFKTYTDEEITKYAVCYCGIYISRLVVEDLIVVEPQVVEGTEMDECCVCFNNTLYKTRCSHTLCDTCCPQLTTPICPMCRQCL